MKISLFTRLYVGEGSGKLPSSFLFLLFSFDLAFYFFNPPIFQAPITVWSLSFFSPGPCHSHSVVPGGLAVKSNIILEMPWRFFSSVTIFFNTAIGSWSPGKAGTPVMKSDVMNVRMTTECWHDGTRESRGSRSKCIGVKTIGIWDMARWYPLSRRIFWAMWSASRNLLKATLVNRVGVISWIASFTAEPNTQTTLFSVTRRPDLRGIFFCHK